MGENVTASSAIKNKSSKQVVEASQEEVVETCQEEVALDQMKHPLEHVWCFWLYTNEKKNWEENQKEVTKFDTVEDYWRLHHHIKQPSQLPFGLDYSVFKQGIRPMWEDRANKRGGRWLLSIDKKTMNLDHIWTTVVLLLIGENFEHNDAICGAVVNVRGKSKVAIWVADKHNDKANKEIGRKLKATLKLSSKIGFYEHNSTSTLFTV